MIRVKRRDAHGMLLLALLGLLPVNPAWAGLDDYLKAALNSANPDDLKKSAAFAYNHPSCLQNLAPPTLVPYVALSGSLDGANQSGALDQVGLGFNDYRQCSDKVNPGTAAIKQLAPVLKPVCGALNMDCQMFEGQAAEGVNANVQSEAPLLGLLPCACAAATSGLGVEKIAELVNQAKKCGATLAQVGEAFSDTAEGIYDIGGDAIGVGSDAAAYALELGKDIAKSVGDVTCAVSTLWGGCKSTPPSYKTTATAICNAHQSTWWAASQTQAPNDIWVQCNDGLYCWAAPGENLRCEQRRTAAQRDSDLALMKQWCPEREQELQSGYQLQCHDPLCKLTVTNVASQIGESCLKLVAKSESKDLPTDAQGAERKSWLAGEYLYISKFDQLVVESIRRDLKTAPAELLATYDCRNFLGKEGQFLCKWPGGFQACKKLVDQGKVEKCFQPGGAEYPRLAIKPGILTQLGNANDTDARSEVVTTPISRAPPSTAIAGSNVLRINPGTIRRIPPVESEILVLLAQHGCRTFLGREDERLCEAQAGFDLCLRAIAAKQMRVCRNAETGQVESATGSFDKP